MDNPILVIVIAALATLVLARLVWLLWTRRRSRALKEQFGPEYDRAVSETGDRAAAEKRLDERWKRVEEYDLRPLEAEKRLEFRQRWDAVQRRFVDDPRAATAEAQRLVNEVMEARGYPIGDERRQQEDVSVENPGVVVHYLEARRIAARREADEASTEDLRLAMKHCRSLFAALLEGGVAGQLELDESEARSG